MCTLVKRTMFLGRMVDNLDDPTPVECSALKAQLAELQSELIDAGIENSLKDQLLNSVRNFQEMLSYHCPEKAVAP